MTSITQCHEITFPHGHCLRRRENFLDFDFYDCLYSVTYIILYQIWIERIDTPIKEDLFNRIFIRIDLEHFIG